MTQLVLSLVHSHSFLWMRKYAGNRTERRSLSDLRAVMARHFLSAFILPTVAPKLKCVVFAAVADYSSSPKHISEHIEFSSLPAFFWRLHHSHGPHSTLCKSTTSFSSGVWLAQRTWSHWKKSVECGDLDTNRTFPCFCNALFKNNWEAFTSVQETTSLFVSFHWFEWQPVAVIYGAAVYLLWPLPVLLLHTNVTFLFKPSFHWSILFGCIAFLPEYDHRNHELLETQHKPKSEFIRGPKAILPDFVSSMHENLPSVHEKLPSVCADLWKESCNYR